MVGSSIEEVDSGFVASCLQLSVSSRVSNWCNAFSFKTLSWESGPVFISKRNVMENIYLSDLSTHDMQLFTMVLLNCSKWLSKVGDSCLVSWAAPEIPKRRVGRPKKLKLPKPIIIGPQLSSS